MSTLPAIRTVDPQTLIASALDKGASVETVERLVALAERMEAMQAKSAYHAAVSAFQAACPEITKDSDAKIRTRAGHEFTYSFASLPTILSAVRPVLGKHGLSVSWRHAMTQTHVTTECLVTHEFGHVGSSGEIVIPIEQGTEGGSGASPAQRVGIATTYGERYALKAVLGLAPEDDDDAGSQHEQDAPSATVKREDGSLIVVDVKEVKGGKPGQKAWIRYDIHFDDGSRAATFDAVLGRTATQAKLDGALCIAIVEKTDRGVNLLSLTPASGVVKDGPVEAAQQSFADDVGETDERGKLNEDIVRLGTVLKLKGTERATHWTTYCGGASPDTAGLDALRGLVGYLRTRAGE